MSSYIPTRVMSTSHARERLAEIIDFVQDPREFFILTRHGRRVAAVVSMKELHRIHHHHTVEDVVKHGKTPASWKIGSFDYDTLEEAAEAIQKTQLNRRMEREVLKNAGLTPIPGGEVAHEVEVAAPIPTAPSRSEPETPRAQWWQRLMRRR